MIRRYLAFFLCLIIIILFLLVLVKEGLLSIDNLKNNKDLFTSLKDIVTIIAILFGAVFTYYRFFVGRTFSHKAETDVVVHLIETPNNTILHCIKISLKNIGNLAIWYPKAKISLIKHEGQNVEIYETIENIKESDSQEDNEKNDSVVNSGESVYFFLSREVSKNIWAVTYKVEVESADKKRWLTSMIVENIIKRDV